MMRLFVIGAKTHNGLGPADFRADPDAFENHEQLGRVDSIRSCRRRVLSPDRQGQHVFVDLDHDLGRERA